MKILFSPSESKLSISGSENFDFSDFIFSNLANHRKFVVEKYLNFVSNASNDELIKIYGSKEYLGITPDFSHGIKAILRYTGVAYKALDYASLDENSKAYIDENVLIFSNLFGITKADMILPDYKLKQGEKIGDFDPTPYFESNFKNAIDEYLRDDFIIDLRAGFYEKFYKIKQDYISIKFVKNGKVVSHYAKHYRGIFLRFLAKNLVKSKNQFENMQISGLKLVDIKKIKFKTEFLYEIL